MSQTQLWQELIKAAKYEVLPATGCTEPVSLALACAIAASYLNKQDIIKIDAKVSPNLMKNGMGVTVPGTGTVGLHIAAAVGALGGDPQGGLEVLRKLTPEVVAKGKQMIANRLVNVSIAQDDSPIYSEANLYSQNHHVQVCIRDAHTNVVSIVVDGKQMPVHKDHNTGHSTQKYDLSQASVDSIIDFAAKVPFQDIEFILEAARLNDALSQEGIQNTYGLHIGQTLKAQITKGLLADDLLSKILIRSTAASDARMGGATLPAMSNSGSGNQGIAATMPVVVVADFTDATQEQRARALILSHVLAVYIHSKFPALSALCAASTASMGAAAGMAWLLGQGNPNIIKMSVSSMIGDLTGMICDGASNSCAMKVSSSAASAFKAVLMALDNTAVTGNEGIVCGDVEESINNLGALASHSMTKTDEQIIRIMSEKKLTV